jgi:hypothetical protein
LTHSVITPESNICGQEWCIVPALPANITTMAEVTEVTTTLVTYGTELITAIKKFNITGTGTKFS